MRVTMCCKMVAEHWALLSTRPPTTGISPIGLVEVLSLFYFFSTFNVSNTADSPMEERGPTVTSLSGDLMPCTADQLVRRLAEEQRDSHHFTIPIG